MQAPETQTTVPAGTKRRILLVDDEGFIRNAGSAMMGMLGYEVRAVESGELAVACVRDGNESFDLAIVDLTMPDMDGAACFRELRRVRPALRVLLTSGYRMTSAIEALMAEGALGLIEKPFTLQSLRDSIERACAG